MNAPYGNRSADDIISLTKKMLTFYSQGMSN